ncbi:MAG TPA: hypothetical protein VJK03_04545 [Candidatus Nanoarchaeia archaeon]|nr:hypothetical protein [Candidatus Nanoarchaeia archaeon]
MKIKKDKYFRERGSTAKIIKISCMKCNSLIFVYQKDGPGWLKRCYLNRIISPEYYSNKKDINELNNLVCACGNVIGSPFKYRDGRLAYHLIRGKFKRSNYKEIQ